MKVNLAFERFRDQAEARAKYIYFGDVGKKHLAKSIEAVIKEHKL